MSETKLGYEKWRQAAKNSQHAKFGCENFFIFLFFFKDQFFFLKKKFLYIYIYNKIK